MCVYVCVHLCRADGLTQLTSNAALLSIRVATEGMFSTEAGWKRALLKWVVDGGRFTEQVTHGHCQTCRKVLPKNQRDLWLDNAGVILYFSCQEISKYSDFPTLSVIDPSSFFRTEDLDLWKQVIFSFLKRQELGTKAFSKHYSNWSNWNIC